MLSIDESFSLHETARKILMWDILVVSCATYFAIQIPLQVVFDFEVNVASITFELFASALFIADIFVTLARVRNNKTGIAIGVQKTKAEYYRGQFVFDLLAIIPVGLFSSSLFLGLFRLAKLVKVMRVQYAWRHYSIRFSNYFVIVISAYWMILITHWMACGWIAMGGIEQGGNETAVYVNSLYWIVQTTTSTGYGDIIPVGVAQTLYSILVMITGFIFFGYLVGNIAGFLFRKDPAHDIYVQNLERLSVITRYHNIPRRLQRKIHHFFTYTWSKKRGHYEADFLNSLPEGLRGEVVFHVKQDILENSPLFENSSTEYLREIADHLKFRLVAADEYVFKAGEIGDEMYFVVHGDLEVLAPEGEEVFDTLSNGDFFGEIALIKNQPRNASIKAVSYCSLYTISRDAFNRATMKYPEFAEALSEQIEERDSHE